MEFHMILLASGNEMSRSNTQSFKRASLPHKKAMAPRTSACRSVGRRPRSNLFLSFFCWALLSAVLLPGLRAADGMPPRINPSGIRGSLVLAGGGQLPSAAKERFLKLAGGNDAKLVIIPTAANDVALEKDEGALNFWKDSGAASLVRLHTRSREQANDLDFLKPLNDATGVWFDGGSQSLIADAYVGTKFEELLHGVLGRNGVVGGTSAGAAIQSRVMIAQGHPIAEIKTGFDLLPGCIVDQHFTQRDRRIRLVGAIENHPTLFGLGIDEGTAVIVQGREMEIIGDNQVTVCLAKSTNRPAREIAFSGGEQTDLTRWRRAALARTLPTFPVDPNPEPRVTSGSLLIVGGGGLTKEIVEKFIELAGGPEAPIIVLPTANPDPLPNPPRDGRFLERAGCKNVTTLNARDLADVSSPEFLAKVKEARGVWFGGGRQWRFVDAYGDTPAIAAFQDVLARGGVIGGSSAGATIQGDLLVRGSPQGNQEMLAEGYERGFAFLPGTAIDQHFTQRKREVDLLEVMQVHPQILGIGLDETTAIVVRDNIAEVMGKDQAHFFNAQIRTDSDEPARVSLEAGKKYDLVARKELTP